MSSVREAVGGFLEGSHGDRVYVRDEAGHRALHHYAGLHSEVGADIFLVSRALGHSRPSTTLNHYGHLASGGLEVLRSKIDMRGAQPLHR